MGLVKKERSEAKQFTWSSFMDYYNSLIDQEILSFCKNKKHSYYGGKCTISSAEKTDEFSKATFVIVISVLYYKEPGNEKVLERTIKSKFNYQEFTKDTETLSVLRRLLKESIGFSIEPPGKGGIK